MKKLILIRHGETEYTKNRRYCGRENIPLNKKGIKQAERLASKLRNRRVDRVYSSDLARAFHTARIVFAGKAVFARRAFREINFGKCTGMNFGEISTKYPALGDAWVNSPERVKIPGGESLLEMAKRARRCFNVIFAQNRGKIVAIVAHGGVIRVILLQLMGHTLDKFWKIEQSTAAINVIEFKNGNPKFLKINDTNG